LVESFLHPRIWRSPSAATFGYAYSLKHIIGTKTDGEEVDFWFRATLPA
jgi:hypothetical protein